MKVKELIETLNKFNPETEVMYWDAEDEIHYPAIIGEAHRDLDAREDMIIEIDREG